MDAYDICEESIYPNIKVLLKILATVPVTSCTPERSFSTLRNLLIYLRSTMGNTAINGLAFLNVYEVIPVNAEEVLNELCKTKGKININI